jgi:hypothetical protein
MGSSTLPAEHRDVLPRADVRTYVRPHGLPRQEQITCDPTSQTVAEGATPPYQPRDDARESP